MNNLVQSECACVSSGCKQHPCSRQWVVHWETKPCEREREVHNTTARRRGLASSDRERERGTLSARRLMQAFLFLAQPDRGLFLVAICQPEQKRKSMTILFVHVSLSILSLSLVLVGFHSLLSWRLFVWCLLKGFCFCFDEFTNNRERERKRKNLKLSKFKISKINTKNNISMLANQMNINSSGKGIKLA